MSHNQDHPSAPWRTHLLAASAGALLILAALYLVAARGAPAALAQPPTLSMAITKTNDGSSVVRVGEYISFTIRITNTGTVSITQLPVIDEYDARVLRLDSTTPPASTTSAGQITWTNLPTDTAGGPLPPGGTVVIHTRFRIIGISDLTINRARVQDARGLGGQSGGSGDSQSGGTAQGGRVILTKALAPGTTAVSGQPITFTIGVTNDGAADLVTVPIQDLYQAQYLRFWKASPPPTTAITGELRWDNVLQSLGLARLRPNDAITITTVFTAEQAIDGGSVNRAGAAGVRDEFQNELAAPNQAELPIRILPAQGAATPTPTPRPRRGSRPDQATPTPTTAATPELTPAATLELTPTAAVTPTATVVAPAGLPRTGGAPPSAWLVAALALLLSGAILKTRNA